MESKSTDRIGSQLSSIQSDDESAKRRLDTLLKANVEIARQRAMFRSDAERIEAELMKHPLGFEKTFAYFGLLLGTFPPASFFLMFFISKGISGVAPGILILLIFVNLVTAVAGYFSGKVTGTLVRNFEKSTWSRMAFIMPLIGFAWGAVCGGIGGVFLFVIGAVFGAIIGGSVGAIALPVFVILHLWLKRGDSMDRRHFLPVAFGITFTICSFILGLRFH